jgi:glycosyltransferase involved in cell wall biosynthesis
LLPSFRILGDTARINLLKCDIEGSKRIFIRVMRQRLLLSGDFILRYFQKTVFAGLLVTGGINERLGKTPINAGCIHSETKSKKIKLMKLLIVGPTQGHYGGIEAFIIALASEAQSWPEVELQVCFKVVAGRILADDLKQAASSLNCPVHFVSRASLKLFSLLRWATIVHCQNASPDVIFPSWLMGKGLVLTIHNWRKRSLRFHPLLWGVAARLAHRRWYNSKFVWGTWEPGRKLSGSDCVPTVCRLPKAWCPPAERRGFLFVGRWIENKGIEDLITAYSQAGLDNHKWPLTLLGHGPLKPKVLALIKQLGLDGVVMPGFIDDEGKAHRMASARWLVAPARTREDLGLTPIEARSLGVPVIVTRDGGLPEAGGEAALIVEPGNVQELTAALRSAATMSEEEYGQRAEQGRKSLGQFLRPWTFYRDSYAAVLA